MLVEEEDTGYLKLGAAGALRPLCAVELELVQQATGDTLSKDESASFFADTLLQPNMAKRLRVVPEGAERPLDYWVNDEVRAWLMLTALLHCQQGGQLTSACTGRS